MPLSSHFPGLIEWNSSYSLDIDSIDSQHRLLVSLIRHLQESMLEGRAREAVAPLFAALNQYTRFHFEYEEQLLKEHEYPTLAAHHGQHADLAARLLDLERQYTLGDLRAGAPLMQFLRNWLYDHISDEDRQYASFLKMKGVV